MTEEPYEIEERGVYCEYRDNGIGFSYAGLFERERYSNVHAHAERY
jgi:hypothetical protein